MKNQIVQVRTEREILSSSDNPWIVSLHCSFQDQEKLYLVLEYVPGGDLMNALSKIKRFPEKVAQFFCGEILLALQSIHSQNFLHRDIKPDNVLIMANGHIKLTDFGLATNYQKPDKYMENILDELHELMLEDLSTVNFPNFCGCEYSAPEIFRNEPATILSDFWSYGVILYEMVYGFSPFHGENIKEIYWRIMNWDQTCQYPNDPNVSTEAIDLMRHLICESNERFGFEQIVHHPFFDGFCFENVASNRPPFVPLLKHPTDTSHFDEIEPITDEPKAPHVPNDLAKFAFLGYTYQQKPNSTPIFKVH